MNFGEIKAFLGNKPQQSPNIGVQQQLRDEGLKQAAQGVAGRADIKVSQLSSQTSVGLRIYNHALNQSLELDNRKANLPKPEENSKSLFDFEEVAKNVLRFVGGVINSAARGGADQDKLSSLFEQARSGVAKGIKLAEQDLSGFLNEDITEGISASANLIEQGIQRLQDNLLGESKDQQQNSQSNVSSLTESLSYSNQQSGEINIRTRDGDELRIRFEDLEQFNLNRTAMFEGGFTQPVAPEPVSQSAGSVAQPVQADSTQVVDQQNKQDEAAEQSAASAETQPAQVAAAQQSVFVQQSSFGFSVTGELDQDELNAIGKLVSDASDLAETFFDGDMETAFNQALELGYDKQELTGFALQLSRQEQVQMVKAYETVSHYNESSTRSQDPVKAVEPISDYLDKMLNVLEQSQQKLLDGNDYENLVNGIINQVQDVNTTDLLSAINKFHSFNKQLLESLPSRQQEA